MRNKIFVVMVVIISVFLFYLISFKESNSKTKDLKEVDIVLEWYPNAVHSFIYTAIDKGYFKDEGLKVNIRYPSNPTDSLLLTAAGYADLGIYYMYDTIVAKTNQNIPVTSVASITQRPLNVILSLQESNILTPINLEGKKIGHSGLDLTEKMINYIMLKDGAGLESSFQLIDIGFDIITALLTKNVDAVFGGMLNHEIPFMKKKNIKINYFTPDKYGLPNYYELIFVAGDDIVKNKPLLLKKMLKAMKRGFDYTKNNKEEALNILWRNQDKEQFPLDIDIERDSLNILLPIMEFKDSEFLNQDTETWQRSVDWLFDNNVIKQKLSVKDYFNNSLQ